MKRERLKRLLRAAEQVVQDRSARIAGVDRRFADVERERGILRNSAYSASDPGAALPVAQAWELWREARLRDLSIEEARLKAECEALRVEGARALGRREVFREINRRGFARRD